MGGAEAAREATGSRKGLAVRLRTARHGRGGAGRGGPRGAGRGLAAAEVLRATVLDSLRYFLV